MIILTIFLMLIAIYGVIFGTPFYDTLKKLAGTNDKSSDKDKASTMALGCMVIILAVVMTILNLFFFTWGFAVDPLKYPTLIMILLTFIPTLLTLVKSKFNHDSLEVIQAKKVIITNKFSRWTLRGIVFGTTRVAYCGYILWVLMGGAV